MPISVTCQCGKRLRVKDELAGKRVKCPGCGAALPTRLSPAAKGTAPPKARSTATSGEPAPSRPQAATQERADVPAAPLRKALPKRRTVRNLAILVGLGAAILLCGIGLWYVLPRDHSGISAAFLDGNWELQADATRAANPGEHSDLRDGDCALEIQPRGSDYSIIRRYTNVTRGSTWRVVSRSGNAVTLESYGEREGEQLTISRVGADSLQVASNRTTPPVMVYNRKDKTAAGSAIAAIPASPTGPTGPGPAKESTSPAAPTSETPKQGSPKASPAPPEPDDWPSEPKSVPIPDGFKAVSFSRGGGRVAFVIVEGKQFHAVIDGRREQPYDEVSIVTFAPSGKHYYYGGYRDKQWHLVRDGKEAVQLGRLTNRTRGTGLQLIGEGATFIIARPLVGAFAEAADNYMIIGYGPENGRFYKDGEWLPVSFRSFSPNGMAFSPDGKRYCFAVRLPDAEASTLYIDGAPVSKGSVDGLGYRAATGRFIYRQSRAGTKDWALMEDDQPLPGFPPLPEWRGSYALSPGGHHVAALVKKGEHEAVVIDGKEEPSFPTVDWAIDDDFAYYPGSLVWSKDGNSHAYAVYDQKLTSFTTFGEVKDFPAQVVFNGKPLGKQGQVRGSSVSLSDDGKHLAYAVKQGDHCSIIVDGEKGEKHHAVGNPVFLKDGSLVYAAKTDRGWELCGAIKAGPFREISYLSVSRDGGSVAFAAKAGDGKWTVFSDGKAVSEPFDGIVAQAGLRFDGAGRLRFVGKAGRELKWVTVSERGSGVPPAVAPVAAPEPTARPNGGLWEGEFIADGQRHKLRFWVSADGKTVEKGNCVATLHGGATISNSPILLSPAPIVDGKFKADYVDNSYYFNGKFTSATQAAGKASLSFIYGVNGVARLTGTWTATCKADAAPPVGLEDVLPRDGPGDPKLTYDVVNQNPNAYRGKRATWPAFGSTGDGKQLLCAVNYRTVKDPRQYQMFAVDFASPDEFFKVLRAFGGTITGTVVGKVTVSWEATANLPGGAVREKKSATVPLLRFTTFVRDAKGQGASKATPGTGAAPGVDKARRDRGASQGRAGQSLARLGVRRGLARF